MKFISTMKMFENAFSRLKVAYVNTNISLQIMETSGEASPIFGHANANFSVFIDRIRNQFLI